MKTCKKLVVLSTAIVALLSTSAQAQDASGLSVSADAGAGVIFFDTQATTDVPRAFYGVSGHIEACDTGGVDFNLCGGVAGFSSIGKQTITVPLGNTKSSVRSVGAYVKAKKNLGEGTSIAPYAGIARYNESHDVTIGAVTTNVKANGNVAFGGLEFDKQFTGNMSLSLKAEAGRSIGSGNKVTVYGFKPGLKVKF